MFLGGELFDTLFASQDYKTAIKNGYYIGFLGHPEDPGCMDFEHACIVMKECHKDNDGQIYGTFDLIDTPVGRIVKAFIDAGVIFGISIRGAGDISGDGTVDPETFVFRGFDLVTFPAYNDAVPEFQEIAASSDLSKQVKYKKVVSTINKNLSTITSGTTLDAIQAQFNEKSDEYQVIADRKSQMGNDSGIEDEDEDIIMGERVAGMTALYLEQVSANTKLRKELIAANCQLFNTSFNYSRRLHTMERIAGSQIKKLEGELDSVTASYNVSVRANARIKDQLVTLNKEKSQLENTNLKYTHKIEANSKTICAKDSTISDLEARLRKTVTASSKVEKRSSNLDEDNKSLRTRVEAAEQTILAYQQAYANMYANALGVHLEDMSVTASTSVKELKSMVMNATNTAGMIAAPFVEPEPIEVVDDEDEDESNVVTL